MSPRPDLRRPTPAPPQDQPSWAHASGWAQLSGARQTVSCVLPCRDKAHTLAKLLPILSDTLTECGYPWEVIVVDCGSRDGTGELDELQFELHERLKTLRKGWADQLDTDPAYVINRHVLLRLAKEQPSTWDALERIFPPFADWQLDDFGDELLDAIDRFHADVRGGKVESKRRRPWRG